MNKELIKKTKLFLLKKFNVSPQIAIITGSGINIFKEYTPLFAIKYTDLPVWSNQKKQNSTFQAQKIKGHEMLLKLYKINKKSVLVFCGRHHLYEGLSINDVVLNVRLAYELGVKKIITTNAAGGINKEFKVGDLMLITGFINFMQSTERGTLSTICQPPTQIKSDLTKLIQKNFKTNLRAGIYAGVLGPSYETHSEIRLFKNLGADAVGMSTIPEIICAKSLLMNYAAISVISNIWNNKHKPSHQEVVKHVNNASDKLDKLICNLMNYQ